MSEKVYVVTAGEYSSKHIVGVFDSREKAEEYQKYSSEAEPNMIEEYGLNILKPDHREKLFAVYSEWDRVNFKAVDYDLDWYEKDTMWISETNLMGDRYQIMFCVSAVTREQAIKIGAERLARVKAEEDVMYPFLRRKIPFRWNGRSEDRFPEVLYHTGEIFVVDKEDVIKYAIPALERKRLRLVSLDELRERYHIKEEQE